MFVVNGNYTGLSYWVWSLWQVKFLVLFVAFAVSLYFFNHQSLFWSKSSLTFLFPGRRFICGRKRQMWALSHVHVRRILEQIRAAFKCIRLSVAEGPPSRPPVLLSASLSPPTGSGLLLFVFNTYTSIWQTTTEMAERLVVSDFVL